MRYGKKGNCFYKISNRTATATVVVVDTIWAAHWDAALHGVQMLQVAIRKLKSIPSNLTECKKKELVEHLDKAAAYVADLPIEKANRYLSNGLYDCFIKDNLVYQFYMTKEQACVEIFSIDDAYIHSQYKDVDSEIIQKTKDRFLNRLSSFKK